MNRQSSDETITASPLTWPAGWHRTPAAERTPARFHGSSRQQTPYGSYRQKRELSVAEALGRVGVELDRLGVPVDDVVISTNLELRLDGLPRSGQREPDDPGAAVYWVDGDDRRCMAIDRYDRVADNLAAIAATLEAMRAIERHGGAEILDRAFTGFVALPAPEQWFEVLGVPASASVLEITTAYRELASRHHPDRGGDADTMARINRARDEGLAGLAA